MLAPPQINSDLFIKNLRLLKEKDPDLAEALNSFRPGTGYIVTPSQQGPPSLSKILATKKRMTLHSSYDPVREAERMIESCDIEGHDNFFVLGLGLGYHLQELVKRVSRSARIIIIEKEIEVLFHCLANNDFSSVMDHAGVSFQIGANPASLVKSLESEWFRFGLNGYSIVKFKPLVNLDIEFYSKLLEEVDAVISERRIDSRTQAAFSKKLYHNIFDNWKNILTSPGIHSLKNKYSGMPAIIVSAGPSLDKNIGILKKICHEVLVLATATALRPLILNGIKVDFVVAIDPEESTHQFFNFQKLDPNICLVFDPCVPASIVDHFPNRRIRVDSSVHLSQWIAGSMESNNFLGKTLSVAHTALLFAQHLGCDPIILVGQDLSFDRKRLHCADSHYDQVRKDKVGAIQPLSKLEENRFSEFSPSSKFAGDIFGNEIVTTSALEAYKNLFADKVDGSGSVFNATEGGLPIPGIPNISLREAVNALCPEKCRSTQSVANVGFPRINSLEKMKSALKEQIRCFDRIIQETQTVKNKYFVSSDFKDDLKVEFVGRMETFYRFLLDQTETLKLMQGYSYKEFLEWNRKNGEITAKAGLVPEDKTVEDKFQRDKKFLGDLEEASESLKNAFEKMARAIN